MTGFDWLIVGLAFIAAPFVVGICCLAGMILTDAGNGEK